jgi:dienelactone hydrolase
MKNLFPYLVLIAMLLVLSACTASSITATPATPTVSPTPIGPLLSEEASIALAQKTIASMIAQDFADAYSNFDQTMQAALPQDQLKQAWDSLIKQAGAYEATLATQPPVHQAQYIVVLITLQFKEGALDMRVVVDPASGKVSGLRFMPNQTEAAKKYQPPAYADPNSFEEREVVVGSDEWQLSGTLTLPKDTGPFPAVVLVHGSGPNDRDETIGPDKPFKDIAWGLAARGIAVLRYEKRTKVYGEKMAALSTLTVKEETIDDAVAAVDLLRHTNSIDPIRIFVLGHSLGGYLIPRIGQATGSNIAGLIILAGPTRHLEDLMLEQTQYILSLDGSISPDDQQRLDQLTHLVKAVKDLKSGDPSPQGGLLGAPAAYWLDLQHYQPAQLASSLTVPLFILQGERDYQVTLQDFQGWKDALSSKSNVQLKTYPDLNHLFMTGTGKSTPTEYNTPANVSVSIIDDIAAWVKQR